MTPLWRCTAWNSWARSEASLDIALEGSYEQAICALDAAMRQGIGRDELEGAASRLGRRRHRRIRRGGEVLDGATAGAQLDRDHRMRDLGLWPIHWDWSFCMRPHLLRARLRAALSPYGLLRDIA